MSQLRAPPQAQLANRLEAHRPAVNLRSVLVGLLGVIFVCAYTPFNDQVLNSSLMIGGALPVALVLFMFVFALFVNGPLSYFFPKLSLRSHEMAVVLTMILVTCVIPGRGLMAFWPGSIATPHRHATTQTQADFKELFDKMGLPDWLWPRFVSQKFEDRGNDDVVQWFYSRIPEDTPSAAYWRMLARWVPPTIGWGIFFGALGIALLGLSFIVRKQWVENERILFPLAQVQSALVEAPEPRRFFNSIFGSGVFWTAFLLIVALRLLIGLNRFFPRYVPAIALTYDFRTIMSEPPLSYMQTIHIQTLYPIIAAVVFFVSSRISFSLWFFMVLAEIHLIMVGAAGAEFNNSHRCEINTGSIAAFALMILWTGRHHYWKVLRVMFSRTRPGEDPGLFINDRTAGWMLLGGATLAAAWLVFAMKMTAFGAVFMIVAQFIIWMVLANVVAHSGLLVPTMLAGPRQWAGDLWFNPNQKVAPTMVPVYNHFGMQFVAGMWAYSADQLPIYGTHALKVASDHAPRSGRRLIAAILLALVVGFLVAEASTLLGEYRYATTLDKSGSLVNAEIMQNGNPIWSTEHARHVYKDPSRRSHQDKGKQFCWYAGTGFIGTGLLAFLQLRFTWWPLHPIGLLMVFSYSARRVWFSIVVGWLIKVLVVRFGGGGLFRKARPFFMGIIIGEVVAAGCFAMLSLVLYWCGVEYEVVRFLPTALF